MAYSRPGVYITERLLPATLPQGPSADAAGAVVAPFAQGPETVTRVTSWYDFTKYFGGYNASYPATFQVAAFFQNGGRELYVQRLLASDAVKAEVEIVNGSAVIATVQAKNAGIDGNNLRLVVTAGQVTNTFTFTLYKESGVANDITDDILLERYENLILDDSTSSDFAETVINIVSPNITVTVESSGLSGTDPVSATYPLTGGATGTAIASTDYTNYKAGGSSVFERFSSIERPLVLFLPVVNALASGTTGVYDAATSWAEDNNGFVVVDTDPDLTVANAVSAAAALADTSYAAAYYPHYFIADPLGRGAGALRKIGPSGAIAGVYLANDASRGVFKAPAGLGTPLLGAVVMERTFTSTELDTMNASTSPVNVIRALPGAGICVMGARTLKQDGTANKYVNMRRSLIYIRKQLKNITEFAIFENNDEKLWSSLRTVISAFLVEYKNQGGLRGARNADAFFIKCDGENNTAQSIANGEVRIQVGVALQYPAEFVVIDLSQKTAN